MPIIDKFNLLSDNKLQDTRIKICDKCHLKTMRLGEKFCTECNCFIKYKVKLNAAACPLDPPKW